MLNQQVIPQESTITIEYGGSLFVEMKELIEKKLAAAREEHKKSYEENETKLKEVKAKIEEEINQHPEVADSAKRELRSGYYHEFWNYGATKITKSITVKKNFFFTKKIEVLDEELNNKWRSLSFDLDRLRWGMAVVPYPKDLEDLNKLFQEINSQSITLTPKHIALIRNK